MNHSHMIMYWCSVTVEDFLSLGYNPHLLSESKSRVQLIKNKTDNYIQSCLYNTGKLSARFARASTFLAPAESFQRISDDPP